jgi:hypothetical protein
VVVNLMLIPGYGAVGAAIASTLSYGVVLVDRIRLVRVLEGEQGGRATVTSVLR